MRMFSVFPISFASPEAVFVCLTSTELAFVIHHLISSSCMVMMKSFFYFVFHDGSFSLYLYSGSVKDVAMS